MKSRIFLKLLLAAIAVIAIATVTLDVGIRKVWQASLQEQIATRLRQNAQMFAAQLGRADAPELNEVARLTAAISDARVTVIRSDGRVLFDSEAVPEEMENHATRPEFKAALRGNFGSNVRRSHTLGIDFMYVAVPVEGGAVRLAYPLSVVHAQTAVVRRALLRSSLWALLVATLLAAIAARNIARRLQRITRFARQIAGGDLQARLGENSRDEIGQVAAALDLTVEALEHAFAEQSSARAQFETLLNSLQDAVFAVGGEGTILWANGAMREMAPLRIGDAACEVMRDPDVMVAIADARGGKASAQRRAYTVFPGRAYRISAAPLAPGGAVVLLHDITQMDLAERTRRDFVANVSHELRTPLTSVLGYAEMLRDQAEEPQRSHLDVICRNAARMTRLTEDLLMLARVESGELKLRIAAVEAHELLEDAMASFATLAKVHGVELRMQCDTDAAVLADKDAIHQVFANLIDNALKYAPESREVVIGARAKNGGVEFFVRDFGPGISSEHQGRLFERFYRVDRARSRETGGTGLGLSILKHIVLAHGGTVRMESKLGMGAIFLFTLPLALAAAPLVP